MAMEFGHFLNIELCLLSANLFFQGRLLMKNILMIFVLAVSGIAGGW